MSLLSLPMFMLIRLGVFNSFQIIDSLTEMLERGNCPYILANCKEETLLCWKKEMSSPGWFSSCSSTVDTVVDLKEKNATFLMTPLQFWKNWVIFC